MLTRLTKVNASRVNLGNANWARTNVVNPNRVDTDKVNTDRVNAVNANRASALISTKAFLFAAPPRVATKLQRHQGKWSKAAMSDWTFSEKERDLSRRRRSSASCCYCSFGWVTTVPLLPAALQYLHSSFHRWNGWFARRAENHWRQTDGWGRDGGSVGAPVRSPSVHCRPEHRQAAHLREANSERLPKLLATSKTKNECWRDSLPVRAECQKVTHKKKKQEPKIKGMGWGWEYELGFFFVFF